MDASRLSDRLIVPISSSMDIIDGKPMTRSPAPYVLRDQTLVIRRKTEFPFKPSRFMISQAGTQNGSLDWIVNSVTIDGVIQNPDLGALRGDQFAPKGESRRALLGSKAQAETPPYEDLPSVEVSFDECHDTLEIAVTYKGDDDPLRAGCPFYAAFVGTRVARRPEQARP
jgi:hypothetical protein